MPELVNIILEDAATNKMHEFDALDSENFESIIAQAVQNIYEGDVPSELGFSTKDGKSVEKINMSVLNALESYGNHIIVGRPNDLG